MNNKSIPLLRPVFLLTKKDLNDFDREAVTHLLCTTPTETSGPVLSKGKVVCSPNIQEISSELVGLTILPAPEPPYQMMRHAYWSIEMEKIESWSLGEPLEQLERILDGKQVDILQICKDYNLSADLIVRVFAESNNMPELTIPSSSVAFWASMGVSIGFDFYLD